MNKFPPRFPCSHATQPRSRTQAANILGLLAFVKADVNAFRPRADIGGFDYGDAGSSSFGTAAPSEPRFPKSLFLVQPLSSAYELNPVAASAQDSVPVPDGLDLNAWMVPPPKEETAPIAVAAQEGDDIDTAGGPADEPKPKKIKKGKGKDVGGKAKGKRKANANPTGADTLAAPPETPEERAERERVRSFTSLIFSP